MPADTPSEAARSTEPDVGQMTASDGVALRWLAWGDPEAPPLVLLHGLRSYAATFARLADDLSTTYRCIAPDARGRGGSAWDPQGNYHTDRYVQDLSELVDLLQLETFDLLGHSMGGSTAYVYTPANPGRVGRLIIEDIVPGSSLDGAGAARIRAEVAATPAGFASREDAVRYWQTLRPKASVEAIGSRVENTVRQSTVGDYAWEWIPDMAGIAAARLDQQRPPVDLWPSVRALTVPTLVVCGADSDFSPAPVVQAMTQENPHITSVTIQNAGHYVHDDQPDLFRDAVRAHLAES